MHVAILTRNAVETTVYRGLAPFRVEGRTLVSITIQEKLDLGPEHPASGVSAG